MPLWAVALRIVFGVVILVDAILEYQSGTYQVFDGIIYSNASVTPEPLRSLIVFAAQAVALQPAVFNGVLAALEAVLGLSVLAGAWAEISLPLGIPLFLGIWVIGQGLGLPFSGSSTDIQSGLLYILLDLVLWWTHSWERWSLWAWARPGGVGHSGRLVGSRALAALAMAVVAVGTWASVSSESVAAGFGGPPAVGGALLALDQRTNQDVLFGGCNFFTCSNQTWVWGGRGWYLASDTGPPQLGYAGGAFDPASGGVVMAGGATSQGLGPALRTSWIWSGRWRRARGATLARGRRFAAVAYDPATRQLVMFGGDSAEGKPLGGTFVWNGSGWLRQWPVVSPGPRTAAAMAWDPGLGALVLYGGSDEAGRLDDTWAWNGSGWHLLERHSAPGRLAYTAMATDPQTRSVLLFAGIGSPHPTWQLSPSGWVPVGGSTPPPVYSFAALATAPLGRGVLLFGGGTSHGSGFSGQTWLFSGGRWQQVAG